VILVKCRPAFDPTEGIGGSTAFVFVVALCHAAWLHRYRLMDILMKRDRLSSIQTTGSCVDSGFL
jgi:hypothetical protein